MGGERESNSVLLDKIGYFVLAYLINAQIGGCSGEDAISLKVNLPHLSNTQNEEGYVLKHTSCYRWT